MKEKSHQMTNTREREKINKNSPLRLSRLYYVPRALCCYREKVELYKIFSKYTDKGFSVYVTCI